MVFDFGIGPLTVPLYTIPEHPSPSSSSVVTLSAGISHSSVVGLRVVLNLGVSFVC